MCIFFAFIAALSRNLRVFSVISQQDKQDQMTEDKEFKHILKMVQEFPDLLMVFQKMMLFKIIIKLTYILPSIYNGTMCSKLTV
jgi:hypothetical protein